MREKTWWKLVCLAALVGVLAFAAACGDDDSSSGTPTSGSSGTVTAQKGGEITIQYVEQESFDPHWSQFAQDIGLERMAWRGLYRLDENLKPQPEMAAAAPQVSSDGKTYTIKLKSALKWSDGAAADR